MSEPTYDLTPPPGAPVLTDGFHYEATICDGCRKQLGLYPCECDAPGSEPLVNDTCRECYIAEGVTTAAILAVVDAWRSDDHDAAACKDFSCASCAVVACAYDIRQTLGTREGTRDDDGATCGWWVGPIWKLDGETCRCTKPVGHEMPHECDCGSWFEGCGHPPEARR